MSVSHPLLKELKGHIFDLRKCSDVTEIRDHHPCLLPLCHNLENIMREGLKATCGSAFGLTKKDYWHWIEYIFDNREKYSIPLSLSDAIESVKDNKKAFSSVGKGRLFIRTALPKRLLPSLLSCLLEDEILVLSMYEPSTSIFGNEILVEILASLLHELSKIEFKLELKNASFLDETWTLGVYRKYEFVPCKEMGITFGSVKGHAVVVKVEEGSVAAEEDQIEVGDVLDELYGRSLYRCKKGLISSLAHQFQGLPVYLCVVKCRYLNGGIYPPLLWILERLGLREMLELKYPHNNLTDSEKRELTHSRSSISSDEKDSDSGSASAQFELLYLGKMCVGKEGRVTQVEESITKVIQQRQNPKKVLMDIGETKLRVIDMENEETLTSKHFTEISACGRKSSCPENFAFIAGNTTCTLAEQFDCSVFKASSEEELKALGEHTGLYNWCKGFITGKKPKAPGQKATFENIRVL